MLKLEVLYIIVTLNPKPLGSLRILLAQGLFVVLGIQGV